MAKPARQRLQRSELAVPATSRVFFEKAANGPADSIFLDLEDAVAPSRRDEARGNAVDALKNVDWGSKIVSVRINGLSTRWAIADILAVAKCPRLDLILLPTVETPSDVEFVDRLLDALEPETPRDRPIGIEILIETTKGLANVESIAACSQRLEGIILAWATTQSSWRISTRYSALRMKIRGSRTFLAESNAFSAARQKILGMRQSVRSTVDSMEATNEYTALDLLGLVPISSRPQHF